MNRSAYLSTIGLAAMLVNANFAAAAKPAAPLPPVGEPGNEAAPLPPIDGVGAASVNDAGNPVTTDPALANGAIQTVAPAVVAEAKKTRVKPVLGSVMSGLLPPVKNTGELGGVTLYPFDSLKNVNDSFGLFNKKAADIQSTITGANQRNRVPALNDDGTPKLTTPEPIKDAAGNLTGYTKAEPVMVATKKFKAYDVDPATYYPEGTPDADRAPTRVFRIE